ncbi:restriction endonuclease [Desulfocurvibacter africanus]|uniref:restriction endonuclease n=1 Tax=Desulfocurvibacter africanus TaxID=873 RepID=UPI0030842D1D
MGSPLRCHRAKIGLQEGRCDLRPPPCVSAQARRGGVRRRLHGKHARKGVFITTGTFAQGAVEYAAGIDSKVVLIDGKRLAELMIEFDVGVSTKATYQVKRIDSDYFNEE